MSLFLFLLWNKDVSKKQCDNNLKKWIVIAINVSTKMFISTQFHTTEHIYVYITYYTAGLCHQQIFRVGRCWPLYSNLSSKDLSVYKIMTLFKIYILNTLAYLYEEIHSTLFLCCNNISHCFIEIVTSVFFQGIVFPFQ